MRAIAIATLTLCCGCSAQSDAISVSGQVSLDGVTTAAEILIEPLPGKDGSTPASTTTFADAEGRFTATLPGGEEAADAIPCRVVVRVSAPVNADVPASLNEQAPPDRVVRLQRNLRDGQTLSIVLTH